MLTLQNKLYVQLAPDIEAVSAVQDAIEDMGGKRIETDQLHLTVLHIGKLERLYDAVRKETNVSETAFIEEAGALVRELEIIKAEYDECVFTLIPLGLDAFGADKSVLVLRFESTDALAALHASSLEAIKGFLKKCGITDADYFIENNHSLRHSLTYKPHVALKKAFEGNTPPITKQLTVPLPFSIMRIVYDN